MNEFLTITFKKNKMKINKIFLMFSLLTVLVITSCTDFIEPQPERRLTDNNLIERASYAEGLLLKAYTNFPREYNFSIDAAADDAVSNDPAAEPTILSNGGWTSSFNPYDRWANSFEMFLYINTFIEIAPQVTWDWKNNIKDKLFAERLLGEAYALRAWYGFNLLQAHGGISSDGRLLGYPIVTKPLTIKDDFKLPRNTYAECVNQIISDIDKAIAALPLTWVDKPGDSDYNTTNGRRNLNRINGITAKLLKSRVLLYAASPAYNTSGITYSQAAAAAAEVIANAGGLARLRPTDVEWYKNSASAEILWASSPDQNTSNMEKQNFPPSLFGLGRTNPTQEFIESFPMRDGTPFSKSANTTVNQYVGRDTRLDRYIVYNGLTFGGAPIKMAQVIIDNVFVNIDAPNSNIYSTRSSYYVKKFMVETVKVDPGKPTVGANHFYTYARVTEALLNFAEAANETQGPDAVVNGFTARQVINAIRTRAGITSTAYINGLDKNGLRTAIRNERRIELCFEGHRFWDIRRWNQKVNMQSDVSGINIAADNISSIPFVLQKQKYEDFQIYGPIPFQETLKYDLKQNKGWQ